VLFNQLTDHNLLEKTKPLRDCDKIHESKGKRMFHSAIGCCKQLTWKEKNATGEPTGLSQLSV